MKLKFVTGFSFLLLCHFSSFAGNGLADWGRKTPGGNEINNYAGGITLYLKNGKSLPAITEWYFYKKHIVGLTRSKVLFIVDEETNEITKVDKGDFLFTGRISNEAIGQKQLEPALIMRSFDGDWQTSVISNFVLLLLFWPFITIPSLVVYLWMLYRAIRHRMSLLSPFTKISIAVSGYLVIDFLLDVLPQSI